MCLSFFIVSSCWREDQLFISRRQRVLRTLVNVSSLTIIQVALES